MTRTRERPLGHLIAFRPGVKVGQVIEALTRQAAEAGNGQSYGAGHTVADQLNHYFGWTETAEPQLANVLDLSEARSLVRTETYWALRTASPNGVRINTLIRDEYRSRQRALEQLVGWLRIESERWEKAPAPLVVPDTNMFLDKDEPIQQFDWATLVTSSIDVRLVIPLVVIHELDRLKRQGNSTTARLAREAIRWLARTLPAVSGRSERLVAGDHGATVEAYLHDGPARPADADGMILDVCGWLAIVSNLPLTLVTKDLGMSLRAHAVGVTVAYLEKNTGASAVVRRG